MVYLISVLVIIVCVLLILIVLIQNPKGGLDSAFSTNNQVMGVRKTTDFLEKATWTMGIALVVLSIVSASYTDSGENVSNNDSESQSKIADQIDETALPAAPPANGVPLPENSTPAANEAPVKETE